MPGNLFLVASPIGNLEDITFRAVRVLNEADMIACEDTRHSRTLLEHYGIHRPTISYHEHNEAQRAAELLDQLKAGKNVALLSDAGTPLISDPGYCLVDLAVAAGIAIHPIPGPSALLASLTAAGFPTDEFVFGGFLPAKAGKRRRYLEEAAEEPRTLVVFEAPHRIFEALADIAAIMPERPLLLAREVTKVHEEFLRGTGSEIAATLRARGTVKGEITLVLGPGAGKPLLDQNAVLESIQEAINRGVPRMQAIKEAARRHGIPKRELYRLHEEAARKA